MNSTASPLPPTGTQDNPFFTDGVPLSAGTAVVIATAGAAIVLTQAALRSWRSLSLGKWRSIFQANLPLFSLVLLLTVTVGAVGAILLFPDDSRAFGGLQPLLGVLAPFAFLQSRPFDSLSDPLQPTRARFLSWLFFSLPNFVLMLPGFALSAACIYLMVRARSWDVLAIAFSASVAVLARTDPPLHFAWDGTAPRWQWGRLLPSPVRAPSWRFVIGRVETADVDDLAEEEMERLDEDAVTVDVDAMEVPLVDSRSMQGALVEETEVLNDRALAASLQHDDVLRSLSLFYNYDKTVWSRIIHSPRNGSVSEGRLMDEAAASAFFLIVGFLKTATEREARLGADVWLLLAILVRRIEESSSDYRSKKEWTSQSVGARFQTMWLSIKSAVSGRTRGPVLTLTDEALMAMGAYLEGIDSTQQAADNGEEGIGDRQVNGTGSEAGEERGEKEEQQDDQVLIMSGSLARLEEQPGEWSVAEWTDWMLNVLRDMYAAARKVSAAEWNKLGSRQIATMAETFDEYIGEIGIEDIREEFESMLSEKVRHEYGSAADATHIPLISQDEEDPNGDIEEVERRSGTRVEEVTLKVAEGEAWTYVMLGMAQRHIVTERGGGAIFESAGVDVSEGEMNGRLTAQNIARKLAVAQMALWGYVALGQTARALLEAA